MIVGVDEPRYQESAFCIDDLRVFTHHQMLAFSDKSNDSIPDGDIDSFLDAGYIDIYQATIPDD
jgi:hypothetical protein